MDLQEAIQAIALRYTAVKDSIQTEEATKSALVMPFYLPSDMMFYSI